MSINRKLGDLANVLDDGTEGQVLSFNASGAIAAADIAAGASVYDSAELLPLTGLSAGDMAYVTGTNRFYISNGTGWYSVSLVNTNPSITSVQDSDGLTTPFTLTTDGTATVITVTASDPEDIPLTYNYSVTSGNLTNGGGTTATVSQADNVFTVTPSTTEAYAGTFELTFTASDGINQGTSTNRFTLSFITNVTNSNYTTLLATAVDTSDNNNITDASSNNHSITVTGDAHAGTFSPYRSGGYSTYFDGTTNTYLNVSTSSGGTALGSGDFTISFWVYCNDATSNQNYLLDYRPYNFNTGNHPVIYIQSDATFRYKLAGTEVITGNTAISSKQWVYFCLARDNGTTKMYVNGTLQTDTYSGTESLTNGTNRPVIGTGAYNISPMFDGYISDLRTVTSLDTTAYSVPTERLGAVTNTSLLTCHLPYIADGSTNDHSITVNGDVSTKPFSPYDYEEYSATDHSGSVYFDGTGDYLTISDSNDWYLDGDFTIETWFYKQNTSTFQHWFRQREGSTTEFGVIMDFLGNSFSSGDIAIEWHANQIEISAGLRNEEWNHVVLQRSGTTLYWFTNGVLKHKAAQPSTLSNYAATLYIGNYSSNNYLYKGYMSDFRWAKGSVVYSTSGNVGDKVFTPPTTPLSTITDAKLHIKGTDASIIDKSQSSNLNLFGNTTGSTTQVKFAGSKSMYFDGSGDGILCKGTQIPTGATESWTIEAWVYVTDTSIERQIFAQYSAGSSSTRFVFGVESSKFRVFNGGTSLYSLNAVSLNTWTHVAVTYNGSAAQLYVDGISQGTLTLNRGVDDVDLQIGARNQGATQPWVGYIQDARVTKGLARYTTNFTPPTASLEG